MMAVIVPLDQARQRRAASAAARDAHRAARRAVAEWAAIADAAADGHRAPLDADAINRHVLQLLALLRWGAGEPPTTTAPD